MQNELQINQFSSHLFWDVDSSNINFEKNKTWLIQRVLEYGLINDWMLISEYYGIDDIAQTAILLKHLDKKSVSFISALSGIPKEKFLCCTTSQLTPKYWNL